LSSRSRRFESTGAFADPKEDPLSFRAMEQRSKRHPQEKSQAGVAANNRESSSKRWGCQGRRWKMDCFGRAGSHMEARTHRSCRCACSEGWLGGAVRSWASVGGKGLSLVGTYLPTLSFNPAEHLSLSWSPAPTLLTSGR